MSNEWYKTDDLQWCKPLGERKYKFIQALWIDTCPNDPENDYVVCSGLIDLNDYSDDEIETAISSYYESYDDMLNKYNTQEKMHTSLIQLLPNAFLKKSVIQTVIVTELLKKIRLLNM